MKNSKDSSKNTQNEAYLALYRKYRPQTFKDVIGQDLAVSSLENAIKNNKLHHAYIFSGDRGIGKTTLARIFAKSIGSTNEDIFEINSASNTGVDDMRLIIEATQVGTFGSPYKVYIFDEAHMLSVAAFNALLKTLEEPPEKVIFILATTRKDKIPNTIISRCQVLDLVSPNIETLIKIIEKVAKSEKKEIDKESTLKIAEMGNGSFRDTLGILEKILTLTDKDSIVFRDIEDIFNLIPEKIITDILKALAKEEVEQVFKMIKNLNLKTKELSYSFYTGLVKIFEIGLYSRFVSIETLKKDLNLHSTGININEIKSISIDYPNFFTSSNLSKLLNLEGKLRSDTSLGEVILITGLIELIEYKNK